MKHAQAHIIVDRVVVLAVKLKQKRMVSLNKSSRNVTKGRFYLIEFQFDKDRMSRDANERQFASIILDIVVAIDDFSSSLSAHTEIQSSRVQSNRSELLFN